MIQGEILAESEGKGFQFSYTYAAILFLYNCKLNILKQQIHANKTFHNI